LVKSPVTISLAGGDLEIAWTPGSGIEMTGGATHVFTGTTDWDDFG
jgi:diaminopimelate epimerase